SFFLSRLSRCSTLFPYTTLFRSMRLGQVIYAVMINPKDGSVWGTIRNNPGAIVRINPGSNPPETALTEVYNVPMPGFGPRGGDRSEEHTSELQSPCNLVCRLLLE